jgi:hypothetical protein
MYEGCSIRKVIQIKWEVITTLNVAHSTEVSLFFNIIPRAHWCICPILARVKKFSRGRNRALAFATIHQQPFPILYYCGICDLPSVADSRAVFFVCYPYQVLPPTEKQNAWLAQKLQARKRNLLNLQMLVALLSVTRISVAAWGCWYLLHSRHLSHVVLSAQRHVYMRGAGWGGHTLHWSADSYPAELSVKFIL